MKKTVSWCVVVGMLSGACGPATRAEGPARDDTSSQANAARTDKASSQGNTDLSVGGVTAVRYTSRDLFRGLFFGRGPVAALLPQLWGKGGVGSPRVETPVDNRELAKRMAAETENLAKAGLAAQPQAKLKELTNAIAQSTMSADELSKRAGVDTGTATKQPLTDADVSAIMDAVAKADATFFDRFGRQVRSGDPAAVSAILEEAAVKFINSTQYLHALRSNKASAAGLAGGIGLGTKLWRADGEGTDEFIDDDLWLINDEDVVNYLEIGVEVDIFIVVVLFVGVFLGIGPSQDFGSNSDPLRHDAWMKVIAADLAT